jgi:hypothetical protein
MAVRHRLHTTAQCSDLDFRNIVVFVFRNKLHGNESVLRCCYLLSCSRNFPPFKTFRVHDSPPLDPILKQLNPVWILTPDPDPDPVEYYPSTYVEGGEAAINYPPDIVESDQLSSFLVLLLGDQCLQQFPCLATV